MQKAPHFCCVIFVMIHHEQFRMGFSLARKDYYNYNLSQLFTYVILNCNLSSTIMYNYIRAHYYTWITYYFFFIHYFSFSSLNHHFMSEILQVKFFKAQLTYMAISWCESTLKAYGGKITRDSRRYTTLTGVYNVYADYAVMYSWV